MTTIARTLSYRLTPVVPPWVWSVGLHGVLILAFIGWALLSPASVDSAKGIFELVKGEGDNYAATEAPKLGTPGAADSPQQSTGGEDSPITPAETVPQEFTVLAAPAAAKNTNKPSLERIIQTGIKQEVRKAEREIKVLREEQAKAAKAAELAAAKLAQQREAEKKARDAALAKAQAIAKAEKRPTVMTQAEFEKKFGTPSKTPARDKVASNQASKVAGLGAVPQIDVMGIAGGVKDGSSSNMKGGAGGTVLTRPEAELSDAYVSYLKQELKRAHIKPEGLSDDLYATAEFRISPTGEILALRLLRSSGNLEFDQSVLAAFRKINLPDPPTNLKQQVYKLDFRMRDTATA